VPDLSHLWHRFVLASALIFGLLLGAGATVFGYSNTSSVSIGWSVFRIDGVPLWTVAIVPLVVVLVAGTLYHWYNSFHHFTQHMKHRHRVHELEAEVATLRSHLDQLLEMPDASGAKLPAQAVAVEPVSEPEVPALPEAANGNGADKAKRARKRVTLTTDSEPVTVGADGNAEPPAEAKPEAASEPAPEPNVSSATHS
jgi:hypothetical protein